MADASWEVAKDLINTATDRAYRLYINGKPPGDILSAAYQDANEPGDGATEALAGWGRQ